MQVSTEFTRTLDIRHVIERLLLSDLSNDDVVQYMSTILADGRDSDENIAAHLRSIESSKDALTRLLARPSITQRTPAWYEARMTMITASDIAQALGAGKFGTTKQFLWKKCLPAEGDTFASLANCPPIKWGTMYEDVASAVYCARNRVHVHEFGLLQHPDIPHMGASPDGITSLGVMLEIKCPYRRQITGEVPLQYFYQIQGQLEVCGLSDCDYLEIGLKELGRDDFYDPDNILAMKGERGIVAEFIEDDKSRYEYSGVDGCVATLEAFEIAQRRANEASEASQEEAIVAATEEEGADATVPEVVGKREVRLRFHYWRVDKYSCQRITRDAEFVAKMLPEIAAVWARVESYRKDPGLMEAEIGLPAFQEKKKRVLSYAFREACTTDTTDTTGSSQVEPDEPPNPTVVSAKVKNTKKTKEKCIVQTSEEVPTYAFR